MTKRNANEVDRKHRERLAKITADSHAALAEPNDDPAAAGFAAAKRDNLLAASAEIFIPTSGLTSAAIEELVTEIQNATISERTGLSDIEISDSPEGLAIKQGRVRDNRTAEDRGEAIATRLHQIGPAIPLATSELDDLTAYLRCGR